MANNRLLLKCDRDGSTITIARLSVGMGDTWSPSRTATAEYEGWLETHSQCCEGSGLAVSLEGECDWALTIGLSQRLPSA